MAKWLRDYLSFGGRRPPPQPPTPDYSESDILRAYREQKDLDFEDPYEDADCRLEPDPAGAGDPKEPKGPGDAKYDSPKHRLIKVEVADMAKAKALLLGSSGEELEADTEYSDPLDAQPHLPPSDDGYMEPYDAQRAVNDLPCRGVQLYDTPYEEQDQEPEDGPLSGQRPRQSRLPREDERPADEYDQPWEWKKDHISRAFAVQFDSPEWERTPGSAKELRRPLPRSPQSAERVDTALPLEKQPWFHGPLSRAAAENLLSLCKEGSYLVRLSETSPQDCSLSVRSSQGSLHLKFAQTRDNQFVLGQHSGPFASVPELILHYSAHPLPVQGAEHLALLYPVFTQTP
ncbi:SH2 domain-containing adapter protein D [Choloepus didactylus]|uniref:SH2 domain-containing adapter protein D n=1 Tax=Choloepus didactylus TaxID=27675 RepID=UPI0018A047EC|nr:SH2 domain-containing adapter protein D [Choloepus didactylus]XP_037680021.1 SH2 domain-containing adapter protein D [Choloepus didactylus]XP_037680022.1 SH2 domain-containing adapter protein D [Choloepus didactylus]XP_037680023.1 SH2 domain-containing adapter protein D [Choloepus didactylus]